MYPNNKKIDKNLQISENQFSKFRPNATKQNKHIYYLI